MSDPQRTKAPARKQGDEPPPAERGLAGLSPTNFALVMATGIVSIGAHHAGLILLSRVLLLIAGGAWLTLCTLSLLRIWFHPAKAYAELRNHLHAPGYFALVAATSVLACQLVVVVPFEPLAILLAILALCLWLLSTYAVLLALTIGDAKPSVSSGLSGSWLLIVVATQSIAVIGALLAARVLPDYRLPLNLLAFCLWGVGGSLYVWIISLIFYRYVLVPLDPKDFTPTYWINMGAMAISALAGSLLLVNSTEDPLLASLAPFLRGGTIVYWATGTWWIPMLVALSVWRYVIRRHPLEYSPQYWAVVFPLGMYAVCTWEMDRALDLHLLTPVARAFLWASLACWLGVCTGLVRHVGRRYALARTH